MHQAGREYSHISLSLAETEHALPISVEERNMKSVAFVLSLPLRTVFCVNSKAITV